MNLLFQFLLKNFLYFFERHTPERGAQCVSGARWDLYGGPRKRHSYRDRFNRWCR